MDLLPGTREGREQRLCGGGKVHTSSVAESRCGRYSFVRHGPVRIPFYTSVDRTLLFWHSGWHGVQLGKGAACFHLGCLPVQPTFWRRKR